MAARGDMSVENCLEALQAALRLQKLKETSAPSGYQKPSLAGRAPPAAGAGGGLGGGPGPAGEGDASRRKGSHRSKVDPSGESAQTDWSKRLGRESEAWNRRRPDDIFMLRLVEAQLSDRSHRLAEAEKEMLLRSLAVSPCRHKCCLPELMMRGRSEAALPALLEELTTPTAGGSAVITMMLGRNTKVLYRGEHTTCVVSLPYFECSRCGETELLPPPLSCCCWPSSPATVREGGDRLGYTSWFALPVLDKFERLTNAGGLSAEAYVADLDASHRRAQEREITHLGLDQLGDPVDPDLLLQFLHPLKPAIFLQAYFSYLRAKTLLHLELQTDASVGVGVMRNCPSCASVQEEEGGPVDISPISTMILDATKTLSSFASAASAARAAGLQPVIGYYFGEANRDAEEYLEGKGGALAEAEAAVEAARRARALDEGPAAGDHPEEGGPAAGPAGELPSGPRQGAAGGPGGRKAQAMGGLSDDGGAGAETGPPGPHDGFDLEEHHNHLHCHHPASRRQAPSAPGVGVAGGVCPCGGPGVGVFVNMGQPETHAHYDIIMRQVNKDTNNRIGTVYLDYACMYKIHFCDRMGKWMETIGTLEDVRFLVDWLHAKGHRPICRYANGAFFIQLTGRRVGVCLETFWGKVSLLAFVRALGRKRDLDAGPGAARACLFILLISYLRLLLFFYVDINKSRLCAPPSFNFALSCSASRTLGSCASWGPTGASTRWRSSSSASPRTWRPRTGTGTSSRSGTRRRRSRSSRW